MIDGYVAPEFAYLKPAFEAGFTEGRDVGAALAVVHDGRLVVDLWGGHTDRARTRPWQRDTVVCMFSVTKAVTAICVLQAVADGRIDLDRPVADHWPEFAAHGKEAITPRQLLSHRAGLPAFHDPVDRRVLYDWQAVTDRLASERPWWPPGTAHGYHARTYGFLLGELLRRATGQTPRAWFGERLAKPHGLDFAIGLDPGDLDRCADMIPARVKPGDEQFWPPAARAMMQDMNDLSTVTGATFQNPNLGPGYMNQSQFRTSEIPALSGHGTPRSIATLYSRLPELLPPDLLAEATSTHSIGPDRVIKSVSRYGLGFMLHHPEAPIGLGPRSFGHAGAGGSIGFYDPERDLGVCFGMNQMEEGVVVGGRSATETTTLLSVD